MMTPDVTVASAEAWIPVTGSSCHGSGPDGLLAGKTTSKKGGINLLFKFIQGYAWLYLWYISGYSKLLMGIDGYLTVFMVIDDH